MVFNDTVTKLGLCQDSEMKLFGDNGYGKITDNPSRLLQFTARYNRGQDRFIQLALEADGKWQSDDPNHVDANGNNTYPIATCSLVAGQRDYQFPLEMLEIDKVFVKVSATGVYDEISPVDVNTEDGTESLYNGLDVQSVPYRYDKIANGVFLDPIPNLTISAGLKVYFKRGAYYFVSTDTTRSPGFASIFHEYLSLHASYHYANEHSMAVAGGVLRNGAKTGLYAQLFQMEQDIKAYFGRRQGDERPVMRPKITRFR